MNSVILRRIANNIHGWRYFCTGTRVRIHESLTDQASSNLMGKQDLADNVPQYDLAIVGGGMVGMALACSLASTPLTKQLKVAIIDSNPALVNGGNIKKDDPPDPRVSTVTPATISLFEGVGAWKYVVQHRHAYFDKMQVWDHTGLGYTRYTARDIDKDVLGCVVENKVLHKSLFSSLQDKDFQKTIYPSRLTSLTLESRSSFTAPDSTVSHPDGSFAKLELSDGKSLYARLVVGSDGSKSQVRQLAGIKTTDWKYPQNAVICTVEHSVENYCAWQRFLPNGPLALLPVGEKFSNIVWSMSPEEAEDRKSMSGIDFVNSVNHALDDAFGPHPRSQLLGDGNISSLFRSFVPSSANESFEVPPKVEKLASERMMFPLSLRHASSYALKRTVLIGDAAHTVHPLAGQGVNMGFADAFSLSKVLAKGVAVGSDIGELSLLREYEAERKPANIALMAALDGIQKGYSVDFAPLRLLRGLAFHGANYISPLKKNIVSYASGEQRLPFFLW
ncbi:hypothetical protein Leryth_002697 [Lithospermum erythrorhizon]|nr:hypothetical protein Leryth_002697 [Lithospermum erythrorhizon]